MEIALAVCDDVLRISASGGLRPNDQVHVTVEHLQQREQLIHRLGVVRLIEQTIQPWVRPPRLRAGFASRQAGGVLAGFTHAAGVKSTTVRHRGQADR